MFILSYTERKSMLYFQRNGVMMEKYEMILQNSPLFAGIKENWDALMSYLGGVKKEYKKNEFIFYTGDKISVVGVLLSGNVHIIKEDFWGNRAILAHLEPGDLFGESFSCIKEAKLPVSVVAVEDSAVLFIEYQKLIKNVPQAGPFQTRLIQNMLQILAQKNIQLTQKMEHMVKRTTREKLMSYLSEQALKAKSQEFSIPFNRQELADYLSVDRSAMSNELCKMRDEGILTFERSHFVLKKK